MKKSFVNLRDEAKQEACKGYFDDMRETISKMTGISEFFKSLSKSAECANKSIRRFSILMNKFA